MINEKYYYNITQKSRTLLKKKNKKYQGKSKNISDKQKTNQIGKNSIKK